MSDDCLIHAKFTHNREVFRIVRYNRAGKWWVKGPFTGRRPVTVRQAADTAREFDAEVYFGLPGGGAFDRALRDGRL